MGMLYSNRRKRNGRKRRTEKGNTVNYQGVYSNHFRAVMYQYDTLDIGYVWEVVIWSAEEYLSRDGNRVVHHRFNLDGTWTPALVIAYVAAYLATLDAI